MKICVYMIIICTTLWEYNINRQIGEKNSLINPSFSQLLILLCCYFYYILFSFSFLWLFRCQNNVWMFVRVCRKSKFVMVHSHLTHFHWSFSLNRGLFKGVDNKKRKYKNKYGENKNEVENQMFVHCQIIYPR